MSLEYLEHSQFTAFTATEIWWSPLALRIKRNTQKLIILASIGSWIPSKQSEVGASLYP